MSAMRIVDDERLAVLEAKVKRGQLAYAEAGRALVEIKRDLLFLRGHTSWDAYCREEFGIDRKQAERMMRAARVLDILAAQGAVAVPIGTTPEPTASHLRALEPLVDEPEQLAAAWREAHEAAALSPTAKDVAAAVEKRKPKPIMIRASEYAESHPKASVAQIARACKTTKAIAVEARRRHPKPTPDRPASADVVDIAGRRKPWQNWAGYTTARALLDAMPRDELVTWAGNVPAGDADQLVAMFTELADRCQVAVELLTTGASARSNT